MKRRHLTAINPCHFDRLLNCARYGHPWLVRWIRVKHALALWWWDCVAKAKRRKA